VHALESRLGRLSCLATQQIGFPVVHGERIRRLLDAGRFDVIHYHNVSLVGGPGILALGDALKLYTAHEHWLVCPTHVLWRHDREPCPGRQCLRCLVKHRRPPQLWRFTGWLERQARHVDVFISPSRFSADKHREFGFTRPMEVLPLFLSEAADASAEREQAETPYFLFVGRLEKIKGLQDVIPLFGHDAVAELWIAGGGDYEGELRRIAEGRPKVRFLGARTPESLRPLYAGALALVAPSRCFEVFPTVLLEAFREGLPVVARRLGPYPELIEQSGGGLLFDSPQELGRILRRLADDAPLRRRLGESGRRAFRARWSESVVLGRYFDVIRRVAMAKGRTALVERLSTGAGVASAGPDPGSR
jgi:glycosyltransferase involved in cell wall biosynthesis